MEENKNCCEKVGEKSECYGISKCCMWKKCDGMKYLIWLIIIVIVFCLGAQFGELKSETRGYHNYRGGMMNWDYKVVKPLVNNETPATPPAPEVAQ